jgi:HPt (histidine-containing phosphotransfer) domain-containing protein
MEELSILDPSVIERLGAETSPAVIPRLAMLYAAELDEIMIEIESFGDDIERLRRALHKAKNSAATFGAKRLHFLSLRVEGKIIDGVPLDQREVSTLLQVAINTRETIKTYHLDPG